MKLGIASDSHDNLVKIAAAVECFNDEGVSLVLHAGDYISPITAHAYEKLDAPLVGVFGNNDGDRLFLVERFRNIGEIYPDHHEFEVDGKHGVLMHEPKFIDALVKSGFYDLVIYGHTHQIDIREGRSLVINPGECGGWLTGRATVAIVETEDLSVRLIDL